MGWPRTNKYVFIQRIERLVTSVFKGTEKEAQASSSCAEPEQLLHGCAMPRLLPNYYGFQPRADHRNLPGVQLPAVSADWRKGAFDRWLFFQTENQLKGNKLNHK